MVDKDKKSQASKITQAPPPPAKLRGSYIPPKDKPVNYEYWNQFPIVSIYEAVYLTIKINPKEGEPEERKNREKYRELSKLAAAHLTFGSLKLFPKGTGIVQVSVWQAWLLTVGWSAPSEWEAKSFGPGNDKKHGTDAIHWKRRQELLEAAEKGLESGELPVNPTIKNLLQYMRDGDYLNCNNVDPQTIQKSIERTEGKLFDDPSYCAAVARHATDK